MRPQPAGSLPRALFEQSGPIAEAARAAAGSLLGLLVMSAVVLCWRRLAGQLDTPLAPTPLLGAGAALAAAAWAVRQLRTSDEPPKRLSLRDASVTVAIFAAGAALSLPATSPGTLLLFWIILLAEELSAWAATLRSHRHPAPEQRVNSDSVDGTAMGATAVPAVQHPRLLRVDPAQSPLPHWSEAAPESPPTEGVVQRLVRSQAADGVERLQGWLRVEFSPGQRTASVHVAFCPPFSRTPTLTARQLDGPPGQIKTVQLLPYGARLDLKLASAAKEVTGACVEFFAEARASG